MTYCYNSAAADDYAHEQGCEDKRKSRLDRFRANVEGRLYAGESVCVSHGEMTLADIVNDELDTTDTKMLADALILASGKRGFDAAATTLQLLIERQREVVSKWIDKNLEDIDGAENGAGVFDDGDLPHMLRDQAA